MLVTCPFPTKRNGSYFYDRWNFLDVSTVAFIFTAFVFRMMELNSGENQHLFLAQFFLAASAPLLFSRVLFLSQIGSALGPMTQVYRAVVGGPCHTSMSPCVHTIIRTHLS